MHFIFTKPQPWHKTTTHDQDHDQVLQNQEQKYKDQDKEQDLQTVVMNRPRLSLSRG